VEYAEKLNKKSKKDLSFVLTTNGILLDEQKINFFKKHKFLIECSVDKEKMRHQKDYAPAIKNFSHLFRSGVPHYSISVFGPNDVSLMSQNFKYLTDLGFKKIQLNYCLGVLWQKEKIRELLNQFGKILDILKSKKDIQLVNLTPSRKEPVILNGELTVDCNGDLYLEFGGFLEKDFLSLKKRFFLENIKNIKDCSFRSLNSSQNFSALLNGYPEKTIRKIILNNIAVGKTIERFLTKFKNEHGK
jgi:sulfatase maturation enzyme AslB (radical SAM superfamily)